MPETPTPSEQPEKLKKKNRKKQERKFRDTDADYLLNNRVRHKHFTDKLALFTAFNPELDITYANNWFAKIEACEALPADETTMHEMAGIKDKRDKKVAELLTKISDVEYWAEKAFKNEPEVLYEFQFTKINRIEQYNLNFIVAVYVMKELAEVEYNADLLAAGMLPNVLPDLETALEEVTTYEIYHEKFKRIRIMRTRIRIKEMNQLFDISEDVRKAAQAIFHDKPEVSGLFG